MVKKKKRCKKHFVPLQVVFIDAIIKTELSDTVVRRALMAMRELAFKIPKDAVAQFKVEDVVDHMGKYCKRSRRTIFRLLAA